MRVWDIHPGYLSRESLLGQHVEIHSVFSVITGHKKGYARHPETLRWRSNLPELKKVHDLTVREMILRGYGHRSPLPAPAEDEGTEAKRLDWVDPPHTQFGLLEAKYAAARREGRIPLPRYSSQFWAHHKYAVMGRGYNFYREIQAYMGRGKDLPIGQNEGLVLRVLELLCAPLDRRGLRNTLEHLWGYFKEKAGAAEKEMFQANLAADPFSLLSFLYSLACKYDVVYLRHSTIFSD